MKKLYKSIISPHINCKMKVEKLSWRMFLSSLLRWVSAMKEISLKQGNWLMILSLPVVTVRNFIPMSLQNPERPRQELPIAGRMNGVIYVIPTDLFAEMKRFFAVPYILIG